MNDTSKLHKLYDEVLQTTQSVFGAYATQAQDAYRLKQEEELQMRGPFAIDRDRILYSGAYRRYQGKTQVFAFTNLFDEEMTNRSLHTTYVSQVARTIGCILKLNLELIEAIALGHDLGHTPFGHDGERALSRCCQKYGIGHFNHNVESLHIVDHISRKGRGLNLTFQVRDGIISHDGEVHNTVIKPFRDKKEDDISVYIQKKRAGENAPWMPATLEGCVVRMCDTIAYIGADIEDAIRYNIIRREDLPKDCTDFLGDSNSKIIDTLVKCVVLNSYEKDFICLDEEASHYLLKLKKFNYERIYTNELVKSSNEKIFRSMAILFEKYYEDIIKENSESKIYRHFLQQKSEEYHEKFTIVEKIRDFIATMTDRYFYEEVKNYLLPGRFDINQAFKFIGNTMEN